MMFRSRGKVNWRNVYGANVHKTKLRNHPVFHLMDSTYENNS